MKEIKSFKIGTDPEFGIYDSKNDKMVASEGLIEGSKNKCYDIGRECYIHKDCVAVEFNQPPTGSKKQFLEYINYCIKKGNSILKSQNKDLSLIPLSSAIYDKEELIKKGSSDFGCSESYCVYTREANHPDARDAKDLRTFGFHIHVGYEREELDFEEIELLVRSMDLFLTIPSILLDDDKDRRNIYGTAGDFRYRQIKNNTVVELRTLGGAMLKSEELKGFVFDQTELAVKHYNKCVLDKNIKDALYKDQEDIVRCIKNSDIEIATKLCKKYKIDLPVIKKQKKGILCHT